MSKGIKEIQAKTGKFRLAVNNEYGERMGILEFNPNDPNLITRIQKGYKSIKEIIQKTEEELGEIGYQEDKDIMSNEAYFERMTQTDAELKKTLDYMFNSAFSSIFGETSVLTPTDDGYMIINILEAVLPVVENEVKRVTEKSAKHYQDFKGRH